MGRARLKSLKESTFLTFLEVLRRWGLKKDKDWRYNAIEGCVHFTNGSSVYLKDLFLYPTDPEFDNLGSTEFSGAFLDEVSEICDKAKDIVMSRLRFKLDEYDLVPKLLMASNPCKGWAYKDYWRPWTEGKLESYKKFIPALVGDNPFMGGDKGVYADNLRKLNKNSKERLLYGNWNYDDDPSILFEYDKILDIFTNHIDIPSRSEKYLICDYARKGMDKTIVFVWNDWFIEKVYINPVVRDGKFQRAMDNITYVDEVVAALDHIAKIHHIPKSNQLADDDGNAGGVVDTAHINGFVNGSSPVETEFSKKIHNYRNLKTQCWYKLADKVQRAEIGCYDDIPMEIKELIIEDLEQIKSVTATGTEGNILKEGKLDIISKDKIFESLRRSTDCGDVMMMRCYFDLHSYYSPHIA